MLLSTERIRQLVESPETSQPVKERLVITPVLDWELQAKAGQNAVDLRLGQTFLLPQRMLQACVDTLREERTSKRKCHVRVGDYIVLHPRQFILGETLEWVRLPRNYGAFVMGRSSWGREGLIIATAEGVHRNYSGILTLELTNLGEVPIKLYPGMRIAQLFVFDVLVPENAIEEPRFSNPHGSTGPDSIDPAQTDRDIICKICQIREEPD